MTNYLAVATVTAALKNIIQTGIRDDLPGTVVTAVTPESLNNAQKERKINIYLYQVSPSKELRQESSIPNRRNGRTKEKSVRLNLYYLITFYGNELELEPQQLLGSTIRSLLDRPLLEREAIEETIIRSDFLANSTLTHQMQKVSFALSTMTPEELTRIWSTLFRTPYSLSIPYMGKAVLIEGEKAGKVALPVRRIFANASTSRPLIEAIESSTGKNKPITLDSNLVIYGEQLSSPNTRVRLGNVEITPKNAEKAVTRTKVELELSDPYLYNNEIGKLRAGVQSIQVVHIEKTGSVIDPIKKIESNALPIVLCPKIVGDVKTANTRESWNNSYSAEVTVEVNLTVDPNQRVLLLINEVAGKNPQDYIFPAKSRKAETNLLNFLVRDVRAGKYLIRIQIDGAESHLEMDKNPTSPTFEQYCKPALSIGSFSPTIENIAQI